MKKNPLISIIVPFYNAETYLKSCIDSILLQTYPYFELLLINDGSNDQSVAIANQYTHIENVKLLHIKNQGVAKARSFGFHHSNGNYILFVDADDWIKKKTLQKLIANIDDADMVICNYKICYPFFQIPNHPFLKNKIYTKQTALKKLSENQIIKNYFWGRLYKRELLNKVDFTYDGLFEDIYMMHKILMQTKKVIMISYQGYCYRMHSHSLTSSMDFKKTILMKQAFLIQQKQISALLPTLKMSDNPLCMADIMLVFIAIKQKQKHIQNHVKLSPYSIKNVSFQLFFLHLLLISFYQLCQFASRNNKHGI